MVKEIMDLFINPELIDILGNWYPRVMAVMSCVIPFMFILGVFAMIGLTVLACWRAFR